MGFALQFFLYYVLWPFLLGFGSAYIAVVVPEFFWWFCGGMLALWLLPPLGTFRRRLQWQITTGLIEEQEQSPGKDLIPPLVADLAIALVVVLALIAGSLLARPYLEATGVDVNAKLETHTYVGRK